MGWGVPTPQLIHDPGLLARIVCLEQRLAAIERNPWLLLWRWLRRILRCL